MEIRSALDTDIEELERIGKSVEEFRVDPKIKGFWTKKQLLKWIESKNDVILIAEEDNKIIGFVMFAHHIPTGKVTFENAWIDENFRGKNIIEELVSKGLKSLKEKGATYLCALSKTDNLASIKFLEKNKFMKGFDFTWMHREI